MDDSYLALPNLHDTRRRRLYTFVVPLQLQIVWPAWDDGEGLKPSKPQLVAAIAAEGMDDEAASDGERFLVLDSLFIPHRCVLGGSDDEGRPSIVWVRVSVRNIAAEQIRVAPWERRSILDLKKASV